MKIQTIKNLVQKPARKILPYAVGALALMGCSQGPAYKIENYCIATNKSEKECANYLQRKESSAGMQAVLDSLVYRDLLNNSELANDTAAVEEFNRISVNYRYSNKTPADVNEFNQKLIDSGISAADYKSIDSKILPDVRQFCADKYLFGKFFAEKGLMAGDFSKKFETVSSYLRPSSVRPVSEITPFIKPNK